MPASSSISQGKTVRERRPGSGMTCQSAPEYDLRLECPRSKALLGDGGLMQGLKRSLMQRILAAGLTDHLGYEPGEAPPPVQPNRRNATGRKTVKGEAGAFEIDVPRDRDSSFEPRLIGKGQTRIDGLDDKIVAMYGRGMSVRELGG